MASRPFCYNVGCCVGECVCEAAAIAAPGHGASGAPQPIRSFSWSKTESGGSTGGGWGEGKEKLSGDGGSEMQGEWGKKRREAERREGNEKKSREWGKEGRRGMEKGKGRERLKKRGRE